MSRPELRISAIVAIADGRYADALRAVEQLQQAVPVRAGVCRYCSCTEIDPCSVIVQAGPAFPPAPVACSWIDGHHTVCSNRRCVDQWLTAADATGEQLVAPRIVLP